MCENSIQGTKDIRPFTNQQELELAQQKGLIAGLLGRLTGLGAYLCVEQAIDSEAKKKSTPSSR